MMNFIKKIANLFSEPVSSGAKASWIYVRCNRCGEQIKARVDLAHDLSVDYGEREADTTYLTRKVLIGERRCYQRIEVELTYDHNYRIVNQQIKGGEFISAEEYLED